MHASKICPKRSRVLHCGIFIPNWGLYNKCQEKLTVPLKRYGVGERICNLKSLRFYNFRKSALSFIKPQRRNILRGYFLKLSFSKHGQLLCLFLLWITVTLAGKKNYIFTWKTMTLPSVNHTTCLIKNICKWIDLIAVQSKGTRVDEVRSCLKSS